ncbi:LOW QUALITY PROTEIN: nebulin-related-anchoring protein [Scyliorhinus canicula]|uniref:LOW QUALITY PROTEIN: nebulin-related-anchoring protein n=1 Tax=Scyliorhinus canicula TaxID=7830 RepID=UPI0018F2A21E|nr:LOW QUALITY PROTEIN: nebulin-related-anchoring protein [Scyliorhinus canicula]
MNIPCARCGFGVYPAEKVVCIDQTWHKSCFHCEVCKMILTVNNFISHQKKPFCHAHNPKVNKFTSILDTPLNLNVKKQSQSSEIKYREEAEKFKSVFHWDIKSKQLEHACTVGRLASKVQYTKAWDETKESYHLPPDMHSILQAQKNMELVSKNAYKAAYEEDKSWYSACVTNPELVRVAQAQKAISDVEYKRGHGEFISQYNSVVDTPQLLHAKAGGILASDLKYHEDYEKNIKGQWSQAAGAQVAMTRENSVKYSQPEYSADSEETRGKGSFPAMITPAYYNAKRANELASDIKYKKDLTTMKGSAQYHILTAEEDLAMKHAKEANKLVSEIEYKKDLDTCKGYSINYCETPQFKNIAKLSKFTSDLKYKEAYHNQVKGHYEGIGMDRRTLHCLKVGSLASDRKYKTDLEGDKMLCFYAAGTTPVNETLKKLVPLKDMYYRQHAEKSKYTSVTDTPEMVQARINAQQLSNLNYRAQYEKTKTQYTSPLEVPHLLKAKANADLYSDIKYKEFWEKNKGKGFHMKLDSIALLAAKTSGDLASDIKYKEAYEKTKGKAMRSKVYDSKTLHSLRVSKMSSEVEYKKNFVETNTKFHLPLDMVNLAHAKKAQALASDLEYRKRLHEYTLVSDDMKVKWAKKAYGLQSENKYRADLTWMKGVGWEAERSLDVEQAKKAGNILSEKMYRQRVDALKFTSVADTPQIIHAKRSQDLQSDLTYKMTGEQRLHQYSISKDEPLFRQAKENAKYLSDKLYKSDWESQKEKSFELRLDTIAILEAKAKRDLASDVKYKEAHEKIKGKLIGVKDVAGDSQMAHSVQASKMQSDLEYKKKSEATKTKIHLTMDMLELVHAKQAQSLATDRDYKKRFHQYTVLPGDMKIEWAKRAYALQSNNQYKSDLNWMRGVGWITSGSLNAEQAKKAGELISEKKYRQHPHALKFTSVTDSPEMIQAKLSYNQAVDRLYREDGENVKHHYTLTKDLPEFLQAKINATNISEIRYRESWTKLRDGGYKLLLDAIPIQAAKASSEIISDYKYKEAFEKTRGRMVGTQKLEDDLNISHSVHAARLNSDLKYRKDFEETKTNFHLPMDMVNLVHAKKVQALASDQNYRHTLHHYTALPDDMKLQWAKHAYELQSENLYRSDLNFMRGVAWISTGALGIEGVKRASALISEKKYRQNPYSLRFTQVTDSPDLTRAKLSNIIANERLYKAAGEDARHHYTSVVGSPDHVLARINTANLSEVRYKQSWLNQQAHGYKLTLEAIPFQSAKASRQIASDYQYKNAFVREKGKHIGARSILDDPKMLHCMQVGKLQSEKLYKKQSQESRMHFHSSLDMVNLVHARNAQALASDLGYKKLIHAYTTLPCDMKMQLAKRAYNQQSEIQYKSDLNFLKGVAWMTQGSPQIETMKKAGELISEKKYRQNPDTLKFTSVIDSADIMHAKKSYLQCSDRLYRSQYAQSMHRCTIPPDHPDFKRARINAYNISDKAYKTSWEQMRALGYDLRLDAIPFQTAKASREIASDYKYKQAFVKEKGQQIGFRSVDDDTKMKHFLAASRLQSAKEYKKEFEEGKSKYKLHLEQPGFVQAKKSQEQASNINYRQYLHQWTCDSEQLNVKHAKEAYKLQSDVAYKSDLNWIRGIGWTPPGYHKVEMVKRAADMAYAQGLDPQDAAIQFEQFMQTQADRSTEEPQWTDVMPDATEMLQVKKRKMKLTK